MVQLQRILHHQIGLKGFCHRARLVCMRNLFTQIRYFNMKSIGEFIFCLNTCAAMQCLSTGDCPGCMGCCLSSKVGLHMIVMNTSGRSWWRTYTVAHWEYSCIWHEQPVYEDGKIVGLSTFVLLPSFTTTSQKWMYFSNESGWIPNVQFRFFHTYLRRIRETIDGVSRFDCHYSVKSLSHLLHWIG